MLSSLIAHIIITITCLWSGFLFYKIFRTIDPGQRPLVFYAISGLVMLTVFAQIVVLFFPMGLYARFIIAAILLITLLWRWKDFKHLYKIFLSEVSSCSALSAILFLITWLVILLINAGPTIMDDTESYHIQSIKWIQEYGSVPGLVNLHERFGFNSSWFSSIALFSFSSKTTGGFTVLNSVISVWLCYWFIAKYQSASKRKQSASRFCHSFNFHCMPDNLAINQRKCGYNQL